MIGRWTIGAVLALGLLAAPPEAATEPAGKVARIGILGSDPGSGRAEALRQGLRELGYVEGRADHVIPP